MILSFGQFLFLHKQKWPSADVVALCNMCFALLSIAPFIVEVAAVVAVSSISCSL